MTSTVGVLALQGAFASHIGLVEELGLKTAEVRTVEELDAVDALVLPGGESTTMSMLLERGGLLGPLKRRIEEGMPVLGTCAGMILCSAEIVDGRPDQHCFQAIEIVTRRNAYGRQIDSFEAEIDVTGLDHPFHGVFIRAPIVEKVGDDVEVLAEVDGQPVLCRQGSVTVASFHPELSGDSRLHRRWLIDSGLLPVDGSSLSGAAASVEETR